MAAKKEVCAVKLPYADSLDLKQCVDGTDLKIVTPAYFNIVGDVTEREETDTDMTTLYSINPNIEDLCDTLDLHMIYLLKVKATCITNDGILSCLKCIENPLATNLLIRVAVYKKTRMVEINEQECLEAYRKINSTNLTGYNSLHIVTEVDYGQEMIFFLSFMTNDAELRSYIENKLFRCFIKRKGSFDVTKCEQLIQEMREMDQLLQTKAWANALCKITTMSFTSFCPTSLASVAFEVTNFFKQNLTNNTENLKLDWKVTTITEDTTVPLSVRREEENIQSNIFPVRITLQYVANGDTYVKTSEEHVIKLCCMVYNFLRHMEKETKQLDDFVAKEEFNFLIDQVKMNRTRDLISRQKQKPLDVIRHSFLTCITQDAELKMLSIENLEKDIARPFIENLLCVPPGNQLNLILIGKTGYGKTSTKNSIDYLNDPNKSCAVPFDTVSSTLKASKTEASAETRLIKVVDTQGLFNTQFKERKQIIADAVEALTDGVMEFGSNFSLGFVFPFGTRFSDEDRNTIKMIKTVLGDEALSEHAVLIFTRGDEFNRFNNDTFEKWLQMNPSFNDLVKECGNRYVLFDNITTDPDVKKAQLLKLVIHLDQLSLNHYTGEMFEEANLMRAEKIQNDKTFQLDTLNITLEIIDYFKTWNTGTKVDDRIKESINILSTILNKESSNVKINLLCKNLYYMKNELQQNNIPKDSAVKNLIRVLKDSSTLYQEVKSQIKKSFIIRLTKKCNIL